MTPAPDLIADLRARLRTLEAAARPASSQRVSTGHKALDILLPEKGLRRGTLVEWLEECPGDGAGTLALLAANQACREGRAVVVVDRTGEFYPPAAAHLGLDLEHTLLVRPGNVRDEHWAIHQALASPGVGAVLAWPERCHERMVRRWQLAAEQSGGLGLLVRSLEVRDEPCWADVRLGVATVPIELPAQAIASSAPRRLHVELLRGRGATAGGSVHVEIEHGTTTDDVHPFGRFAGEPLAADKSAG
jgi:hypothetical protein